MLSDSELMVLAITVTADMHGNVRNAGDCGGCGSCSGGGCSVGDFQRRDVR